MSNSTKLRLCITNLQSLLFNFKQIETHLPSFLTLCRKIFLNSQTLTQIQVHKLVQSEKKQTIWRTKMLNEEKRHYWREYYSIQRNLVKKVSFKNVLKVL